MLSPTPIGILKRATYRPQVKFFATTNAYRLDGQDVASYLSFEGQGVTAHSRAVKIVIQGVTCLRWTKEDLSQATYNGSLGRHLGRSFCGRWSNKCR